MRDNAPGLRSITELSIFSFESNVLIISSNSLSKEFLFLYSGSTTYLNIVIGVKILKISSWSENGDFSNSNKDVLNPSKINFLREITKSFLLDDTVKSFSLTASPPNKLSPFKKP